MPLSMKALGSMLMALPLVLGSALDAAPIGKRDNYYGGFALGLDPTYSCPAGSQSCNGIGSTGGPCCPTGTNCNNPSGFCCLTSKPHPH
jgi:hypothetical protein